MGVFLKNGEARAVDGQRGDQFQIAVDTSPVTSTVGYDALLCDPLVKLRQLRPTPRPIHHAHPHLC